MTETILQRRLRAARQLAGFRSVGDLVAAIGTRGFSERQIRAWEQAERTPYPHELAVIAEACGIPARFFEPDFFDAEPSQDERVAEIIADRDYHRELATRAMEVARLSLLERASERAARRALEDTEARR